MKKIAIILLLGLSFAACNTNKSGKNEKNASEPLKVFAVNYPLTYFAERIGGSYIDLFNPIPSGVDPAYWVPSRDLDKIQNVDLILDNGANYAKWMEKVSLPTSKVVNTSEAFSDSYIKITEGKTHSHGGEGEHVHYGYAFTTWLDFKMAAGQAKAVLEAFIAKRPQDKDVFNTNFEKLKSELLELDKDMTIIANKLPETAIFASHPVYQYLGEAYDLTIISEHWEPGEEPTAEQWDEFKHNLVHNPASLMFWEGIPTKQTKAKLLDLNVQIVLFSPCANIPVSGDFITTMRHNIEGLEKYVQ